MKIVLIGYGKMGHVIERIAVARGHDVVLTIDAGQEDRFDSDLFRSADVAIEFTRPEAAFANCSRCMDRSVPVVCGTTGWGEHLPVLEERCRHESKTLFWASNFSIGVNLFFALNRAFARLMSTQPQYRPHLTETHHVHKLDAPSGTAITLAEGLIANTPALDAWRLTEKPATNELPITAVREGEVPGTHTISYTSPVDRLTIRHEAFGREGFAHGAVLAAEYAVEHSGFLTMNDLISNTTDNTI
ncbi:4-hydroxy-tetrahydrodipicolinate reductase [Porphyromonas loveana]|uniref:4-hydroxy-tetrahydrodipicolinate reductase n=1 Tax=Porphyromonas loveana TaxID=1884669 RepID=UPI00359F908C